MKARNVFQILGFRSRPKHYLYEVSEHELDVGTIKYYRWQHPKEGKKSITQAEVDVYRTIINEGDFCLDIGAHTGDSVLPVAIAAGTAGKVLALEPNAYVYHVLEKNIRANRKLTNISSILGAATAEETFITFEYSDSGFCNGGRHENIPLIRHGHAFKQEVFGIDLDKELHEDFSEWLPKLKYIKIDAEGYDLSILEALADIIEKYRPHLKVEVFTGTSVNYRTAMLDFFKNRNYQVFMLDGEPLRKGPEVTTENLNDWRRYDVMAVPS